MKPVNISEIKMPTDLSELISKCYDHINAVTQRQGFLMPAKTLYGDGSRFNNNYPVFEHVYNQIKKYLDGES